MAEQRILVAGAGAIGGVTAALMARAGHDVTLLCHQADTAALAASRGLRVKGVCGAFDVPVRAESRPDALTGAFDIVMIATKAYDMPDCARSLLPVMRPDTLVLSLQNGICTDALAAVVGESRTVGAVVGFGATLLAPAEMEMTSTGEFVIGRVNGDPTGLEAARAALNDVAPTRVSADIYAELYSKLIVNSCITSLGAICGLRLGEMMKRKQARRIFLAIIGEAVNVADAMRLRIPPYGGKLDYHALMRGDGALDRLRRHAMIYIVGLKYKNLKSSSLQSLERGRPTEIDCFNGYIARKGAEVGVACPVCERLTAMVREIERGERKIDPANLFDPAFTQRLAGAD